MLQHDGGNCYQISDATPLEWLITTSAQSTSVHTGRLLPGGFPSPSLSAACWSQSSITGLMYTTELTLRQGMDAVIAASVHYDAVQYNSEPHQTVLYIGLDCFMLASVSTIFLFPTMFIY